MATDGKCGVQQQEDEDIGEECYFKLPAGLHVMYKACLQFGLSFDKTSIGEFLDRLKALAIGKCDEEAENEEDADCGSGKRVMPLMIIGPPPPTRDKCVILDLNGLLLKRYRIVFHEGQLRGFSTSVGNMYNVISPERVCG